MNRTWTSTMRLPTYAMCLALGLSFAHPALAAETIDANTRASAIQLCEQLTQRVMRPGPQPPALETSREQICAQAELKTAQEESMDLAFSMIIGIPILLALIFTGVLWFERRDARSRAIARGRGFNGRSSSSDGGYVAYAGIAGIDAGASLGGTCGGGDGGGGGGGDGGGCA